MLFAWSAHRGVPLAIKNRRGSLITNLREEIARFAVEENYEFVLFLDSDMTFPHDTLLRLLAYNAPVVGCACVTRAVPAMPTAYLAPNKPLDIRGQLPRLMRVWRLGTGVMLIKTDVLRKIEEPRFEQFWMPDRRVWQGEDWGFCDKLEAVGVPIMVDVPLSRMIGHVGSYVFDLSDVKEIPSEAEIESAAGLVASSQSERKAAGDAEGNSSGSGTVAGSHHEALRGGGSGKSNGEARENAAS